MINANSVLASFILSDTAFSSHRVLFILSHVNDAGISMNARKGHINRKSMSGGRTLRKENERRVTWQLFFLLIFWGIYVFTFIVQTNNLPPPDPDPVVQMWKDQNKPDPYTYYPLEYNPFNDRMTLIEACAIWICMFYGLLRIYNIFRIFSEDEQETRWENFFELCER